MSPNNQPICILHPLILTCDLVDSVVALCTSSKHRSHGFNLVVRSHLNVQTADAQYFEGPNPKTVVNIAKGNSGVIHEIVFACVINMT